MLHASSFEDWLEFLRSCPNINIREAALQFCLLWTNHATHHSDHTIVVALCSLTEAPQHACCRVFGRLPNYTSVQHNHIGVRHVVGRIESHI